MPKKSSSIKFRLLEVTQEIATVTNATAFKVSSLLIMYIKKWSNRYKLGNNNSNMFFIIISTVLFFTR